MNDLQQHYEIDLLRMLGNTHTKNQDGSQGHPHCRFHLYVRFPEHANRRKNPFTYRGDQFENVAKEGPHAMLQSLIRNFQRNAFKQQWIFAFLQDTLFDYEDQRRNIFKYVGGVVEESRLHNYSKMLEGIRLIELIRPNDHNTLAEVRQ